jgi:hypothetical protein
VPSPSTHRSSGRPPRTSSARGLQRRRHRRQAEGGLEARLLPSLHAHRGRGDEAERAARADDDVHEIGAGRLARRHPRRQLGAVGQDGGDAGAGVHEAPVARPRLRRTRRRQHGAERAPARPGRQRAEGQPALDQRRLERLERDAGLRGNQQRGLVEVQHVAHAAEIEIDSVGDADADAGRDLAGDAHHVDELGGRARPHGDARARGGDMRRADGVRQPIGPERQLARRRAHSCTARALTSPSSRDS